jgi:hypothetical protein
MGPESVRKPTGWARRAHASIQTIMGIEHAASRQPAGFARHDRSIRPRMNQAHAVVMPHVGHCRPVMAANVHGRSPSCVCVP